MTYIFEFPSLYRDCPVWWKNFVTAHRSSNIADSVKDVGGQLGYSKNRALTIEFESEAHYIWFILRWS